MKKKIRDRLYTPYDVLSSDLEDVPSIIDDVISRCQSKIDKYERLA